MQHMQEEKNVLTKNTDRLLNNENAVLTVACSSPCDAREHVHGHSLAHCYLLTALGTESHLRFLPPKPPHVPGPRVVPITHDSLYLRQATYFSEVPCGNWESVKQKSYKGFFQSVFHTILTYYDKNK
uniref:Uncharacterized protein n=1 Tax=Myotis myotis TaxID=51298 RepID=A0A7J7WWC2_MYOMY|nr:hypothetical protein mMyoMyo1_011942 [Myotis myotis]